MQRLSNLITINTLLRLADSFTCAKNTSSHPISSPHQAWRCHDWKLKLEARRPTSRLRPKWGGTGFSYFIVGFRIDRHLVGPWRGWDWILCNVMFACHCTSHSRASHSPKAIYPWCPSPLDSISSRFYFLSLPSLCYSQNLKRSSSISHLLTLFPTRSIHLASLQR